MTSSSKAGLLVLLDNLIPTFAHQTTSVKPNAGMRLIHLAFSTSLVVNVSFTGYQRNRF